MLRVTTDIGENGYDARRASQLHTRRRPLPRVRLRERLGDVARDLRSHLPAALIPTTQALLLCESVYFPKMKATLAELRRDTSRVLRPVIHGAKTVTLTEHGQEVARISPKTSPDRRRALELLTAIGPVELPSRK